MIPKFQFEDYAVGIFEGVTYVMKATKDEYQSESIGKWTLQYFGLCHLDVMLLCFLICIICSILLPLVPLVLAWALLSILNDRISTSLWGFWNHAYSLLIFCGTAIYFIIQFTFLFTLTQYDFYTLALTITIVFNIIFWRAIYRVRVGDGSINRVIDDVFLKACFFLLGLIAPYRKGGNGSGGGSYRSSGGSFGGGGFGGGGGGGSW